MHSVTPSFHMKLNHVTSLFVHLGESVSKDKAYTRMTLDNDVVLRRLRPGFLEIMDTSLREALIPLRHLSSHELSTSTGFWMDATAINRIVE